MFLVEAFFALVVFVVALVLVIYIRQSVGWVAIICALMLIGISVFCFFLSPYVHFDWKVILGAILIGVLTGSYMEANRVRKLFIAMESPSWQNFRAAFAKDQLA